MRVETFKTSIRTRKYGDVLVYVHGYPEGGFTATPHGDVAFPVAQAPSGSEPAADTAEQAVEALRRALEE